MSTRFLGITVLGDFILGEGVDAVLDNVVAAGATAVACNPTVTAAADEGQGTFQPPTDAGSSPRVFDRPLFGKTSLWVRSGVSYHPRQEFYADSPYSPRTPNDLTDAHGHVIAEFVDRAVERGLKVYFQLGAAQPSGLRDEDRPRLPNGEIPPNRMADTGSLASDAVRAYNRAYVRDLLAEYPNVTGFRPDWPESPCYTLGECFQDFSPHVERWAKRNGFDFDRAKAACGAAWERLHGGTTDEMLTGEPPLGVALPHPEGIAEWLRIKAALSADVLRDWRSAIDEAGGRDKELSANAFMTPYSFLTGIQSAEGEHAFSGADVCAAVSPKLYTMHWSQMVEFWGREILEANPGLDESKLVSALVTAMDVADDASVGRAANPSLTLADYGYPKPDEPHPIADAPQRRKLAAVVGAAAGACAVYPLVHGYGPPVDFERRLRLVAESDADGVWINRYGYLGDEKLRVIRASADR